MLARCMWRKKKVLWFCEVDQFRSHVAPSAFPVLRHSVLPPGSRGTLLTLHVRCVRHRGHFAPLLMKPMHELHCQLSSLAAFGHGAHLRQASDGSPMLHGKLGLPAPASTSRAAGAGGQSWRCRAGRMGLAHAERALPAVVRRL